MTYTELCQKRVALQDTLAAAEYRLEACENEVEELKEFLDCVEYRIREIEGKHDKGSV